MVRRAQVGIRHKEKFSLTRGEYVCANSGSDKYVTIYVEIRAGAKLSSSGDYGYPNFHYLSPTAGKLIHNWLL